MLIAVRALHGFPGGPTIPTVFAAERRRFRNRDVAVRCAVTFVPGTCLCGQSCILPQLFGRVSDSDVLRTGRAMVGDG